MHNHAPEDYTCPFCLLIQGITHPEVQSVQSDIIYHDEAVTAIIASLQFPHSPGNVLVVPNQHFENIYDLPDQYALAVHRLARRIALAMKNAFTCEGISTRQHNEPAGYQDVWHYHLHVTPRYQDDGLYTSQPELMPVSQRAVLALKLKHALDSQVN